MPQHLCTFGRVATVALALSSAALAHADVINGSEAWVSRDGNSHTTIVAPANIGGFSAYQNASLDMLGGAVSGLSTYDNSTARVSGGNVSWMNLYDNSHADVSGADISWLWLYDNSTVRITGADDISWLVLEGASARAEIVANNVTFRGGHLSGTWANGKEFSFWAVRAGFAPFSVMPSNISITAVPEPSTWLLGLIGVLGLAAVGQKRAAQVPHPHL